MSFKNKNYIKKINLKYDEREEVPEFISYERQAAIHDLINENSFSNEIARFDWTNMVRYYDKTFSKLKEKFSEKS